MGIIKGRETCALYWTSFWLRSALDCKDWQWDADQREWAEQAHKAAIDVLNAPPAIPRDRIREIFLAHGFTVKEGCDDLKPYVYEAAEALLAELKGETE